MKDLQHIDNYKAWQDFANIVHARAHRVSMMISDRAIQISKQHLGPNDGMCFLCAHNWQGQSWMTPEQNKAARLILHLERESFRPGDMADRIIMRAWNKMVLSGKVAKSALYQGVL